MVRHWIHFVFLLSLLLSCFTQAALAPVQPKYIDELSSQLFELKESKATVQARAIHAAVQKSHYSKAIQAAQVLQKKSDFVDLGLWLEAQTRISLGNQKKNQTQLLRAIEIFSKINISFPNSPFIQKIPVEMARAEMILGDLYYKTKNFKKAKKSFFNAFTRIPSKLFLTRVPSQSLKSFVLSCKRRPGDLCRIWLKKIQDRYPRRSKEFRLVQKYFPKLKKKFPRHLSTRFTRSYRGDDRDKKALNEAISKALEGSEKESILDLEAFLTEFPRSQEMVRARFWLGKLLRKRKENSKAKTHFDWVLSRAPLTYYGLIASLETDRPLGFFIDSKLPKASSTDPQLNPSEVLRLKRAQLLLAGDLNDYARFDLAEFNPRGSLSSPFLYYLAVLNYQAGNYNTSFRHLSELFARRYERMNTSFNQRLIFPSAFYSLIKKYSTRSKLDPILILSLIKQESGFRPEAISPAGAAGLMQIMPETSLDIHPGIYQEDLIDPEKNIDLGTRYLSRLVRKFDGNLALVLAGYNAGPTRAKRWYKRMEKEWGVVEFIESIPYTETRKYVAGIIRNYYWYSKKLKGRGFKSLDLFWQQ